eukprot:357193-Chlamydomonas_euryale.AAC.4
MELGATPADKAHASAVIGLIFDGDAQQAMMPPPGAPGHRGGEEAAKDTWLVGAGRKAVRNDALPRQRPMPSAP